MPPLALPHWRKQDGFKALGNIIVKNRLVCLTGAGISLGLKRKANPAKSLPGWYDLLLELRDRFRPGDPADLRDVNDLLVQDAPGDWLIQAASILRKGHESDFDSALREALEVVNPTENPGGATSEVHRVIDRIAPRGIMTFNYDLGHESARDPANSSSKWKTFTPQDEEAMLELMRTDFADQFLLKAHGSLASPHGLVLDFESYRALLAKSPTYRAFVGRLLTQFNLLIVGFGMSDPDFDEFMRLISVEIGGPVRQHVLVTKGTRNTPERVLLRRRYGIWTLALGDWSEVPTVLEDALREPGDETRGIIEDCQSDDLHRRQVAHRKLLELSVPGKRVVAETLRDDLQTAIRRDDVRVASELIYSLGKLGRNAENKKLFLELLDPVNHREIIAHAALALDGKLEPADTAKLESCLAHHVPVPTSPEDPEFPDPDNRIPLYLAYLIVQNRRRTAEGDPSIADEPMPFSVTVNRR